MTIQLVAEEPLGGGGGVGVVGVPGVGDVPPPQATVSVAASTTASTTMPRRRVECTLMTSLRKCSPLPESDIGEGWFNDPVDARQNCFHLLSPHMCISVTTEQIA